MGAASFLRLVASASSLLLLLLSSSSLAQTSPVPDYVLNNCGLDDGLAFPPPPPPPADYTLQQVQVFTRHGDRVPEKPVCWAGYSRQWDCQMTELTGLQSPSFTSAGPFNMKFLPGRNILQGGSCHLGQLTERGLSQQQALGKTLRQAYVGYYKLLSKEFTPSELMARCDTTISHRTCNSAAGLLSGLYPAETRQGTEFDIFSMDPQVDPIGDNNQICPKGNDLWAAAGQSDEWKTHDATVTQPLKKQLISALGDPNVDLDQFLDCALCSLCNSPNKTYDTPIPPELFGQLFNDSVFRWTWPLGYPNYTYFGRLTSGALFQEILQNLMTKASPPPQQPSPPKFYLYSGHDVTLESLMAGLGAYQVLPWEWSPYASHVTIELFTRSSTSDWVVRIAYKGQVFTIPGCSSVFCPMAEFSSVLYRLIPNFALEC